MRAPGLWQGWPPLVRVRRTVDTVLVRALEGLVSRGRLEELRHRPDASRLVHAARAGPLRHRQLQRDGAAGPRRAPRHRALRRRRRLGGAAIRGPRRHGRVCRGRLALGPHPVGLRLRADPSRAAVRSGRLPARQCRLPRPHVGLPHPLPRPGRAARRAAAPVAGACADRPRPGGRPARRAALRASRHAAGRRRMDPRRPGQPRRADLAADRRPARRRPRRRRPLPCPGRRSAGGVARPRRPRDPPRIARSATLWRPARRRRRRIGSEHRERQREDRSHSRRSGW